MRRKYVIVHIIINVHILTNKIIIIKCYVLIKLGLCIRDNINVRGVILIVVCVCVVCSPVRILIWSLSAGKGRVGSSVSILLGRIKS